MFFSNPDCCSRIVRMADEMLCFVCSEDMAPWSVGQREAHLNACLDRATAQRCECPTCGRELSDWDERRRLEHVNRCLDQAEAQAGDALCSTEEEAGTLVRSETEEEELELLQTQVTEPTQVAEEGGEEDGDSESECGYVCKICGADMTEIDLVRRIRHVKQCGQKFGVRPGDMAEVEQAEAIAARLDKKTQDGEAPNAFAIMMRSRSGKADAPIGTSSQSWAAEVCTGVLTCLVVS
jgi:transcription initiation factor IIE alpha subunit